jgi:hypothetical protein
MLVSPFTVTPCACVLVGLWISLLLLHAVILGGIARHILYICYSKRGKYRWSKVCTFFDEKLGFMYVRAILLLTYINRTITPK